MQNDGIEAEATEPPWRAPNGVVRHDIGIRDRRERVEVLLRREP